MSGSKTIRYWALKIFIITIIISAGISIVADVFISGLDIAFAAIVLIILISIGILFDIIGIAFATCDEKPFISMSARKIPKATKALKMIKNADLVSNICNDVVGDICGIVSGAAGAAITLKIIQMSNSSYETIIGILFSSLIAGLTVAGKALGKKIAIRNNKSIVEFVGSIAYIFEFKKK